MRDVIEREEGGDRRERLPSMARVIEEETNSGGETKAQGALVKEEYSRQG